MRTLEALRRRIDTIEELRSIVRTMKSLSAVSIRQYERASTALADYEHTVDLGLQAVLRSGRVPRTRGRRASEARGIVVFGSDHGLCGRFNDEVATLAKRRLDAWKGFSPRRLAVGARAADRLDALGEPVEEVLPLPGAAEGLTATTQAILLAVERWQREEQVATVELVHNGRTESSTAKARLVRLLPFDPERFRRLAESRWPSRQWPALDGDPEALLRSLLRQYFFVLVFRAGAESLASEHATRLAALEAAERNIDDHLASATADFRRRRQDSITEELLDVVSGFEALRAPEEIA